MVLNKSRDKISLKFLVDATVISKSHIANFHFLWFNNLSDNNIHSTIKRTTLFNSVTITNSHTNNLVEISSFLSFYSLFYFYLIVKTTKATSLYVFALLFYLMFVLTIHSFISYKRNGQYKNLQVDCIIKGWKKKRILQPVVTFPCPLYFFLSFFFICFSSSHNINWKRLARSCLRRNKQTKSTFTIIFCLHLFWSLLCFELR